MTSHTNNSNYNETAKKLGIKYRIGKYGITFRPKDPSGKVYKLVQFTPLDGWIFDEKEVIRHFRQNGFEL